MSRRQYKNPPIQEAIVEFSLADPRPFDPIRLAQFQSATKEDFAGEPKYDLIMGPTGPAVREIFQSKNGCNLAMAVNNAIGVHVLPPYQGWEEQFKPLSERTFKAYFDVYPELRIVKTVIRYINSIEITPSGWRLAEMFHYFITNPEGLPETMASFNAQVTYLDVMNKATIGVTLVTAPPTGPDVRLLLDISVSRDEELPGSSFEEVWPVVTDLRAVERTAFEACITDRLREKFDV